MPTRTIGPGALVQFTVPPETYLLRVSARGGGGGESTYPGGAPALVTALIDVTPGEVLWVAAGAAGSDAGDAVNGAGIARGGGRRGGAASVLGRGAVSASNAVVIAAGGGGGSTDGIGGAGGGTLGASKTGYGGGGEGGGTLPGYASPDGQTTANTSCGGGGGGLVGGMAGTEVVAGGASPGTKRGAGGGGSSKTPAGATVSVARNYDGDPGTVALEWALLPLAPTVSAPAPGEVLTAGRDLPVAWAFNGASAKDTQSAAEVEYTPQGSVPGTVLVIGATPGAVVPAAAVPVGELSVRVRTRNQTGGNAPWSAPRVHPVAPAPDDPVLTAPAHRALVTGTTLHVAWTVVDQAAYQVLRTSRDGAVVYTDTGVITDSGTRELDLPLSVNARPERVAVRTRGAQGGWSLLVDADYTPAWTRPAVPEVTITSDPVHGALVVDVVHPVQPGRPPVAATSYRAIGDDGSDTAADVRTDPDGVTRWRLPASGVGYVFAVTARSADGVPAVGVSPAPGTGWGIGPWGAGPWGE